MRHTGALYHYSTVINLHIKPDQCELLPLGLTLKLKGKEIIPDGGEVVIDDLPVGGCRRYDSLECLSDVEYRGPGIFEKAYWVYNDLEDSLVDGIHCKGDECKSPDIGWQSSRGIYRKGSRYYGAVRLGRKLKNAAVGRFTCHFEGESVSVNILGKREVIEISIFLRTLYNYIMNICCIHWYECDKLYISFLAIKQVMWLS